MRRYLTTSKMTVNLAYRCLFRARCKVRFFYWAAALVSMRCTDIDALACSRRTPLLGHMGVIVAAAILLATPPACSTVNDRSNPVEWYKNVRDWVSDNQINQNVEEKTTNIPGQDRPFPKVSSVPEALPKTSGQDWNKAAETLISDRENAKYTDEVIRRQITSRAPPPRPNVTRRPPTTSPVIPSNVKPSRLEFGSPPSDIILMQERRLGSVRPGPNYRPSIGIVPPQGGVHQRSTPASAIPPNPDPASLDPSSQVAIVAFGKGSSKLMGNARRIIREVAELQRDRGGNLYVIGHSSSPTVIMHSVRNNMKNFGLSLERAKTVARELLRLGLKSNMVSIGAMPNSRLLKLDRKPLGQTENHRVEIFLEGR